MSQFMMKRFLLLAFSPTKFTLPKESYISRFEKGKEGISHHVVKQCYYCENLFAKNDEKNEKAPSGLSSKERHYLYL